ncbi:MAG: OmpH family outer membrane protein [Rhodobacteraceae bacterium]|nr:OmpH family outer membrane protein [Paracoccaceae bacterium]
MRGTVLAVAVALSMAGGGAQAQDLSTGTLSSPVITIDQEELFARSAWGKRAIGVIEKASEDLAAENRRIEAQLTQEERDLTERRSTMTPEEFRKAADDFDARVVAIRAEQDGKLRALTQRRDAERKAFFQAILPILGEVMQDRGAAVVLDARATLLASAATDVTAEVIARADREIGDGAGVVPEVPQTAVQQGSAPAAGQDGGN